MICSSPNRFPLIVRPPLPFQASGLSLETLQFSGGRSATDALQRALSEIKVLEAFLPICVECKKIRDESGQWQRIETYIGQRTNTQFSHGYCPDCLRRALAEADMAGPVPPGGGGR